MVDDFGSEVQTEPANRAITLAAEYLFDVTLKGNDSSGCGESWVGYQKKAQRARLEREAAILAAQDREVAIMSHRSLPNRPAKTTGSRESEVSKNRCKTNPRCKANPRCKTDPR